MKNKTEDSVGISGSGNKDPTTQFIGNYYENSKSCQIDYLRFPSGLALHTLIV